MNIAVAPEHQRQGIGCKLLSHAIETARLRGAKKLLVGTGTFGYQLMFYQRAGFRVVSVERDFFLTNYSEPIFEHGIQHKDMLRLEIEFGRSPFIHQNSPYSQGETLTEGIDTSGDRLIF
jgi:ribosomal protein S18 acetylase RimI-like enzyme